MKKLALAAVCTLMLGGLTSCEKKYTCTCVYPGTASSHSRTTTTTIKAYKRSEAESTCLGLSNALQSQGGYCGL